jgi:hypothetical protein
MNYSYILSALFLLNTCSGTPPKSRQETGIVGLPFKIVSCSDTVITDSASKRVGYVKKVLFQNISDSTLSLFVLNNKVAHFYYRELHFTDSVARLTILADPIDKIEVRPNEIFDMLIATRENISKEVQRMVFLTEPSGSTNSFDLTIYNNLCEHMTISEVIEPFNENELDK